ncbi:Gfo/Idh/MocA family protein [Candidatus Neomarinimicrobiota bacterium]
MKNVALIGIGKMGLSHLAIANNTSDIKIVAICDTSLKILRLINKYWYIKSFTDYKTMIKEVDIDAILICTPNSTHFSIAKYCIKRGKCIFIEKPLSTKYINSKELISLTQQFNVKGQVGYTNRFNIIFQYLKKILDQGVIGKINSYHNQMIGGVIIKENSDGWRNDYSKGGGCLFDYGSHCFDLSIYLFGEDVKVISSSLEKMFSSRVYDTVSAKFIHNNSVIGINYINWSDRGVRKANNSIKIEGTKGLIKSNKQEITIELKKERPDLSLIKGLNKIYVTDIPIKIDYYLRGEDYSMQMIEFSKLINNKIESSTSNLESASIADKCIDAIIRQNNINISC